MPRGVGSAGEKVGGMDQLFTGACEPVEKQHVRRVDPFLGQMGTHCVYRGEEQIETLGRVGHVRPVPQFPRPSQRLGGESERQETLGSIEEFGAATRGFRSAAGDPLQVFETVCRCRDRRVHATGVSRGAHDQDGPVWRGTVQQPSPKLLRPAMEARGLTQGSPGPAGYVCGGESLYALDGFADTVGEHERRHLRY